MKRPVLLGSALLGVLGGLPAAAQQSGKTFRVGILVGATIAGNRPEFDAFRRTLSGLGYREGTNLEIVYRAAAGDYSRLPTFAADLVRAKPDVIVASSTPAIAAAQRATTSIPIVMAQSADPIASGFVASLARPGGNITGMTSMAEDLVGKQFQLLKELVPRLQRVAVMRHTSSTPLTWRAAESAARALGVQALEVDVRGADQIDAASKTLPSLRAEAMLVLLDALFVINASRIVRLAAALRLPAVYPDSTFAAAGGLMAYGSSSEWTWSQAATYVDRILKGAKPADLPVQRPTIFELIVNLKTAHSLGLTVPQSIFVRADQIIR